MISNNAPRASLRDVMDAVLAEFPHLDRAAMFSPSRKRAIARPRQIAMALHRELGGQSYPQIGAYYRRDHTTILHGVRRVAQLCETDAEIDLTVASLRRKIMAAIAPEDGAPVTARSRVRQAIQNDPQLRAAAERAAAREAAKQGASP